LLINNPSALAMMCHPAATLATRSTTATADERAEVALASRRTDPMDRYYREARAARWSTRVLVMVVTSRIDSPARHW
jgi:hypothetical protein